MRRSFNWASAALVILLSACGGSSDSAEETNNANDTSAVDENNEQPATPDGVKATSADGLYFTWLDGAQTGLSAGQTNSLNLVIWDAHNEPATGLDVAVSFVHKQMGHGGSRLPYAEAVGVGQYTVENVAASMPGTWVLTLDISGDTTEDTVSYEIKVN